MDWTPEQELAIKTTEKNVLVAAAAGSGKTAVLVERIIRLILDKKASISEMLVVTFTDKAANEMKQKIEKKVREKIDELQNSGDTEGAKHFKDELDKLPSANISTFHSFAMEVIHRFFYKINLEPNLVTLDENKAEMMKKEALDSVFRKKYEKKEPSFIDFMDKYSGDKSDEEIKGKIKGIVKMLNNFSEPVSWLDNAVADLDVDENTIKDKEYYKGIFREIKSELDGILGKLKERLLFYESEGLAGACDFTCQVIQNVESVKTYADAENFDGVYRAIRDCKFPELRGKKYIDVPLGSAISEDEVKEDLTKYRKIAKDFFDKIKANYFFNTLKVLSDEIRSTKPYAEELSCIIKEYIAEYQASKLKISSMDFNDMEHYAYEILKNEDVSDYYKKRFKKIFIDEYQDTSVIQEAIIEKIAGEKNLFMVGDVKQSIYGFRNTSPEYFVKRYSEYREMQEKFGEASDSIKIDLNQNFRSKAKVIEFVNRIFEKAMPGYDDSAKLYAGADGAETSPQSVEVGILPKGWEDISDLDESLREYKNIEREALAAVSAIRDVLGTDIYDSDLKEMRKVEARDIVILMRDIKSAGDIFHRVLAQNNIDSFVEQSKGLLDTTEVSTLLSLLSLVDNEDRDIDLLAVMRSWIFNFTIDDLIEIRVSDKDSSYIDAVRHKAESDTDLGKKCREMLDFLKEERERARSMPLDGFIWDILLRTGLYVSLGLMPAGATRQANLRLIVDKAEELKRLGSTSLYEFLGYLRKISEEEIELDQAKMAGADENVVRIMTIHKSKGLEFPIVILSQIGKKLQSLAGKDDSLIACHKDYGLAPFLVNAEEGWKKETLLASRIKAVKRGEIMEEEKRLFYVALTRAKDRLVLLASDAQINDGSFDRENTPKQSYISILSYDFLDYADSWKIINDDDLKSISKARAFSAANIRNILDKKPGTISNEVREIMDFKYDSKASLVKSKYTVSELNREGKAEKKQAQVSHDERESILRANEIGTINHKALEKLDVSRARAEGKPYIDSLVKYLTDEEFMTEEEARAINKEGLLRFANSEIGRRIAEADEVRREENFVLSINKDGVDTLVQGTIDCFFMENGEAVLIDYKSTKENDEDVLRERYGVQIDLYRRAIEEANAVRVKEAYLYLVNQGKLIKFN